MEDKEKNGDGGYGSRQRNKQDGKRNQKDKNAEKATGLPAGDDSTGVTYTNGDWIYY